MSFYRFEENVRIGLNEFDNARSQLFKDKYANILKEMLDYYDENYSEDYAPTHEINQVRNLVKSYRFKSEFELGILELEEKQKAKKSTFVKDFAVGALGWFAVAETAKFALRSKKVK